MMRVGEQNNSEKSRVLIDIIVTAVEEGADIESFRGKMGNYLSAKEGEIISVKEFKEQFDPFIDFELWRNQQKAEEGMIVLNDGDVPEVGIIAATPELQGKMAEVAKRSKS